MASAIEAQRIAGLIQAGVSVEDRVFDSLISQPAQGSPYVVNWTPVEVAFKVACWINSRAIETLVDIGAGPGKLCIIGALTSYCRFVGVEQSPARVRDARRLASAFQVADRVRFVESSIRQSGIPLAQAYYLFNPFEEHLYESTPDPMAAVKSVRDFALDVSYVERFLGEAPRGTYVIKYNGFGGRMPRAYDMICSDYSTDCSLRLWCKTRDKGT